MRATAPRCLGYPEGWGTVTSTVQQGLGHNDVTVQRAGAQGLGHRDVYSTTRAGAQ